MILLDLIILTLPSYKYISKVPHKQNKQAHPFLQSINNNLSIATCIMLT